MNILGKVFLLGGQGIVLPAVCHHTLNHNCTSATATHVRLVIVDQPLCIAVLWNCVSVFSQR